MWFNHRVLRQALLWTVLAGLAGALSGTASALFLAVLDRVTGFRESHLWIIAALPLCGLAMGWVYDHRFGRVSAGGNTLILDEIHDPQTTLPARMAPLILVATWATHLFGGSAGREGTAVQMGASLADQLGGPFRLTHGERGVLIMCGISAGFASVFGTPLAGTVFGLEVLKGGRFRHEAILPCLAAAFIGDWTTHAWGIVHTPYAVDLSGVSMASVPGLLSAVAAGVLFGVVGNLFAQATHLVEHVSKQAIRWAPLRPFLGGLLVALGVWALGTTRYIGLGVPAMAEAFGTRLPPWDFALKLVFTVVTLGSGFKGGEVTPLFFIGATLGSALSGILLLPVSLLAAMGFVGVFAGAAITPLACTVMAFELFGGAAAWPAGLYCGIACFAAFVFHAGIGTRLTGHRGIYRASRGRR